MCEMNPDSGTCIPLRETCTQPHGTMVLRYDCKVRHPLFQDALRALVMLCSALVYFTVFVVFMFFVISSAYCGQLIVHVKRVRMRPWPRNTLQRLEISSKFDDQFSENDDAFPGSAAVADYEHSSNKSSRSSTPQCEHEGKLYESDDIVTTKSYITLSDFELLKVLSGVFPPNQDATEKTINYVTNIVNTEW